MMSSDLPLWCHWFAFESVISTCEYRRTLRLTLFSSSCLLFFGGWLEQLSRAEEKMNGLDGCYCERTCSVKGVVYREDEGWTDGCRNCTCMVGLRSVCLRVCAMSTWVCVRVIKGSIPYTEREDRRACSLSRWFSCISSWARKAYVHTHI